ncbi:DUF7535 family protein [Natronobacterium texcoconense]|uniref:Uncharacterized protein n=1 Tax=Natronobacterium texcoconense TaxID=1095778 RepID=A0A1H1H3F1_NATTX|nr:hypothetical protein [Natronobacterium texcoconense]SDR19909.1 hypothetical protein SAMN04489842_2769 [Natronobacterium texcoconense]
MSTKVSESTGYVPNVQMSAFGYVIAAVLVIVMLPVLPILVLAWILWRVFVSEEEMESSYETWRNDPNRKRLEPPFEEEEEETEEEAEAEA